MSSIFRLIHRQLDVKFEMDLDVNYIITTLIRKGNEEFVLQLLNGEPIKIQKLFKYIPDLLVSKNT